MVIGVCSVKGSPGVTTSVLAMALRWSVGDPVVVEADPAGGDLAARFGLAPTPGVVSFAAAARRQPTADVLAQHCQRLSCGVRAVLGPVDAQQARAALSVLATRGVAVLRAAASSPDGVLLVDVGRWDSSSPAVALVRGADCVLVMTRPRADELSHVASVLGAVSTWTRTPGLVLVGGGYSRNEVERELKVPVLATLPDDSRGAAALSGQDVGRAPNRSALSTAAARLARTLVAHLAPRAHGAVRPNSPIAVPVTSNADGAVPR